MGFTLKGFAELAAAMEKCADVMSLIQGSAGATGTLKAATDPLIKDARGRVHRVTGNLQRGIQAHIKVDAEGSSFGDVGVSYARNKKAHHAHLVEYGHKTFNQHGGPYRDTPPHAFWAPAMESQGKKVLDALENLVGDAVANGFSGK